MKICKHCKREKSFFYFCKAVNSKDGYNYICKDCLSISQKQRYEKNKGIFFRECPRCKEKISHSSKYNRNKLEKLQTLCYKCKGKDQRIYTIDKLERACKKCGKITRYKTRSTFNQAEKENRYCRSCAIRPPMKKETKEKISYKNKGINNGMYGKTHTTEYKNKLQQQLKQNPLKPTKEGIEKMTITLRKKAAERLFNLGFSCPRASIIACNFIEEFGKNNGYNFKHALNGGEFYIKELGYFVDGYDSEKNVVFEYDEKHHFNKISENLKEKDVKRMNEIKQKLNCLFIRYNTLKNNIEYY